MQTPQDGSHDKRYDRQRIRSPDDPGAADAAAAAEDADALHRRALDALRAGRFDLVERVLADGDLDIPTLLESLRVYQAELEVQNDELRASERQAHTALARDTTLFTNLPVASLVVDDYGLVLETNPRARSLLALRDLRSHQYFLVRLVHPDDRSAVVAAFARVKQTGAEGLTGLRFDAADGSRFQADLHIARLPGGDGMPQHVLCTVVDQTEVIRQRDALARAYDALERSAERCRVLVDFSPDWDDWSAPDGRFVYVSPACMDMTGHSAEDFRNHPGLFEQLVHPDDLPSWQAHRAAAHAGTQHDMARLRIRIRARDGRTRWIEHVCRPVTAADGRFLGRRGVNHDITEYQQAYAVQQGADPVLPDTDCNIRTASTESHPMQIIDNDLFTNLCERADDHPRRRAHHLLHASHDEPVQRMLIAIQPGTYFRPHRHSDPPKWELMLVLKGAAAWLGFDDDGRVTARHEAGAHRGAKGLEYPEGAWHALVCLAADTVLFECKPGPFAPTQPHDFATWSPAEDDPRAGDYVRWMLRAQPGQRWEGPG